MIEIKWIFLERKVCDKANLTNEIFEMKLCVFFFCREIFKLYSECSMRLDDSLLDRDKDIVIKYSSSLIE